MPKLGDLMPKDYNPIGIFGSCLVGGRELLEVSTTDHFGNEALSFYTPAEVFFTIGSLGVLYDDIPGAKHSELCGSRLPPIARFRIARLVQQQLVWLHVDNSSNPRVSSLDDVARAWMDSDDDEILSRLQDWFGVDRAELRDLLEETKTHQLSPEDLREIWFVLYPSFQYYDFVAELKQEMECGTVDLDDELRGLIVEAGYRF